MSNTTPTTAPVITLNPSSRMRGLASVLAFTALYAVIMTTVIVAARHALCA
jgi:hypothetical protein